MRKPGANRVSTERFAFAPRRLSIALLWLTAACGQQVDRVEIGPYRSPCSGYEGQTSCLMTREPGVSRPYTFSYDEFEGFSLRWGHVAVIEYSTSAVAEPIPEDGPSVTSRLVRIVSDDVVPDGTLFSIVSRDSGFAPDVKLTGSTEGVLLGVMPFECESAALCSDLQSLVAGPYTATLTFRFVVATDIRLVLTAIAR